MICAASVDVNARVSASRLMPPGVDTILPGEPETGNILTLMFERGEDRCAPGVMAIHRPGIEPASGVDLVSG